MDNKKVDLSLIAYQHNKQKVLNPQKIPYHSIKATNKMKNIKKQKVKKEN